MPNSVCVTGHINDFKPLIEKSRASCPGGRIPLPFIVYIFTILLRNYSDISVLVCVLCRTKLCLNDHYLCESRRCVYQRHFF